MSCELPSSSSFVMIMIGRPCDPFTAAAPAVRRDANSPAAASPLSKFRGDVVH
jgi:hypothetical protein